MTTNAFKIASDQIQEIADTSEGTLQILDKRPDINGRIQFSISIRFDGLDRVDGGLRVRAREPFLVIVPPTFPFHYPILITPHVRFAGFPHVQWRRQICLYASSADWRPEDGMYGFIKRLDAWVRDAALNRLDPDDMPLHPPVAYPTVPLLFVPIADTPLVDGSPWFGVAELRDRNHRTEIVGWKECSKEHSAYFAPAILLHEHLPFEYPNTVNSLLNELDSHGIKYAPFILVLAAYSQHSVTGTPLNVVIGTPMRRVGAGGPALQHLAVWQICAGDADKLRHMSRSFQPYGTTKQRASAIAAVCKWSVLSKVGWCIVDEMRPEVTIRRDHASPMAWFRGKRVAIWGCGAVGTHVAESIVRAGAVAVELVDNKRVAPGVLVRQGFEDADIGRCKADALAERLRRISPDLETLPLADDLIVRITGPDTIPRVDLIIDCTASVTVRTVLEHVIRDVDSRPAIASIAIDGQAATAIATLSKPNHSGCTLDLIRKLKLEACRKSTLSKLLESFWPKSASDESFQPEPGCSEPTFIGSDADLAGLCARMLNAVTRAIADRDDRHTGAGWLTEESGPIHAFTWASDYVLKDESRGYSIRICSHAAREIRGWARRSVRTAGTTTETGGLVFGELNEAAGVLWVTDVDGPPSDSDAAEDHFTCGIDGTEYAAKHRRHRFRGSVDWIGSWHTHPTSSPHPSSVDMNAVAQLLAGPQSTCRTCLILILSGSPDEPVLGAYAFRTRRARKQLTCIRPSAATTIRLGPLPEGSRNVGIALSGGGFRAIAFHLGCLRALNDLNLLSRVQVISSVSGGSIISAMYAYYSDSFHEFDDRVVTLLRRGLQFGIIREMCSPGSIGRALQTFTSSLLRTLLRLVRRTAPQPAPASTIRTEALRGVIAKSLFGETRVCDIRRKGLHTVINATELRTGSAFRFGSRESGCWRFGTIPAEDALVADAVAASAAYPVLLPTLERHYCFTKDGRSTGKKHVVLTDGGVFENLGVGPMEPGRAPSISTNVFDPDYIICCDAGTGLLDDDSNPAGWCRRIYRSYLTICRKVEDSTRKRLHDLDDAEKIKGFALCYLGQQDNSLPWIPSELPLRDEVSNYRTDFASMSTEDINLLTRRGELLTRFLISYYLPDI